MNAPTGRKKKASEATGKHRKSNHCGVKIKGKRRDQSLVAIRKGKLYGIVGHASARVGNKGGSLFHLNKRGTRLLRVVAKSTEGATENQKRKTFILVWMMIEAKRELIAYYQQIRWTGKKGLQDTGAHGKTIIGGQTIVGMVPNSGMYRQGIR